MSSLLENAFSFETKRLSIIPWRQHESSNDKLIKAVGFITTNNVLKTLPPSWQNLDSLPTIKNWIVEREKESHCLAIVHKSENKMIGILLLNKPSEKDKYIDLRVGYLIAETYWKKGFASELIMGLCQLCKEDGRVDTIIGGVDPTNLGSIKVLTRNGFVPTQSSANDTTHFYQYLCKNQTPNR